MLTTGASQLVEANKDFVEFVMKNLLEGLKSINYTQSSCTIKVFNKDTVPFIERPPLQAIISSKSADSLAIHLSPKMPVFELCSGPGAVTTALLRAGVERVFALDYDHECIEMTKLVQKLCPDQLEVIRAHRRKSGDGKTVLNGLFANVLENVDSTKLNAMKREWHEESAGVLLGACQDDHSAQQLLTQYLSSLLLRSNFFQLGRIDYLFLHNQFHLRKVTAKPGSLKYSRFAVLTNILCDVTVIPVKIPSWHLYPALKRKFRQTGEFLSALRLVPKKTHPLDASNSLVDKLLRTCFMKRNITIKQVINELYPNVSSTSPSHIQMMKPQHITPLQYIGIINSLHASINY